MKPRVIVDRAERVGILHERAKDFVAELKRLVIADDDFNPERLGAGADDFDGLRMACVGDEKACSVRP